MNGVRDSPTVEVERSEVYPWIADMEFCHISDDDALDVVYCGAGDLAPSLTCAPYNGEAICRTCGKPTCPRCAQICDLQDRLL